MYKNTLLPILSLIYKKIQSSKLHTLFQDISILMNGCTNICMYYLE